VYRNHATTTTTIPPAQSGAATPAPRPLPRLKRETEGLSLSFATNESVRLIGGLFGTPPQFATHHHTPNESRRLVGGPFISYDIRHHQRVATDSLVVDFLFHRCSRQTTTPMPRDGNASQGGFFDLNYNFFFFIHLLGEGSTLATGMPTSIDVWIAVARHLSQTHCIPIICYYLCLLILLLLIYNSN
jgi:hypothetical protein